MNFTQNIWNSSKDLKSKTKKRLLKFGTNSSAASTEELPALVLKTPHTHQRVSDLSGTMMPVVPAV